MKNRKLHGTSYTLDLNLSDEAAFLSQKES